MGKAAHSDGLILACKLAVNHFLGSSSPPGPIGAAASFHPCPRETTCFPDMFPRGI